MSANEADDMMPDAEDVIARLQTENARLIAALTLVASFEGKTLISMTMGQPYSIGASRAFDQAADIARAALEEK